MCCARTSPSEPAALPVAQQENAVPRPQARKCSFRAHGRRVTNSIAPARAAAAVLVGVATRVAVAQARVHAAIAPIVAMITVAIERLATTTSAIAPRPERAVVAAVHAVRREQEMSGVIALPVELDRAAAPAVTAARGARAAEDPAAAGTAAVVVQVVAVDPAAVAIARAARAAGVPAAISIAERAGWRAQKKKPRA